MSNDNVSDTVLDAVSVTAEVDATIAYLEKTPDPGDASKNLWQQRVSEAERMGFSDPEKAARNALFKAVETFRPGPDGEFDMPMCSIMISSILKDMNQARIDGFPIQ